jgi:predicted nucleic acid-binding protein
MSEGRAEKALSGFGALQITRYEHEPLMVRIWQLRANATVYDAAYLALAELLDAPLLTHDRKFEGIPGHSAQVEVI